MPLPIVRWSSTKVCESRKKDHQKNLKSSKTVQALADGSECANAPAALLHEQARQHVNQHLLYADVAPSSQQQSTGTKQTKSRTQKALPAASSHRFLTNQPSVSNNNDKNAPHHGAVRRVASFTYSSDDKHNKQTGKKFTL